MVYVASNPFQQMVYRGNAGGVTVFSRRNLLRSKNAHLISTFLSILESHAALAGTMDFGCDFDSDGWCLGERASKEKGLYPPICEVPKGKEYMHRMCCCKCCYESLGYLNSNRFLFSEDIPTYEKLFKRKIGFWRRGKGCVLPRKLRSKTCQGFVCGKASKKKQNDPMFKAFREIIALEYDIRVRLVELIDNTNVHWLYLYDYLGSQRRKDSK
jgi:hypothetical protein